MKKYNFNAGPSILPQEVIKQTAEAVIDFQGEGLSILEISHRAKYFQPVVDEAEALMKELLNIPEGYRVIFVGGGASLQFCMVPFNCLEKKAAYLNTGVWSKKAIKEAKAFGEVLRGYEIHEPAFPVLANINARPYGGADTVIDSLVQQIVSPVR